MFASLAHELCFNLYHGSWVQHTFTQAYSILHYDPLHERKRWRNATRACARVSQHFSYTHSDLEGPTANSLSDVQCRRDSRTRANRVVSSNDPGLRRALGRRRASRRDVHRRTTKVEASSSATAVQAGCSVILGTAPRTREYYYLSTG